MYVSGVLSKRTGTWLQRLPHCRGLSARNFSRSNGCLKAKAQDAATSDDNTYASSLLLPKTSFPLWSEPKTREEPFRKRTTEELYKWQRDNAKGPSFVLHDGPPYANGNLHMGHALNKILKDIINRYHVLQGHRVNYIPGWDCHGLPIENKTLEELGAAPNSLPPNELRAAAKKTAEREIGVQKEEFLQFGIMADWSKNGCYRTMDHEYEIRQLRVFQKMVERDLIYRRHRPVYWSPSSLSALAEAELKYRDDHPSRSVYVKFSVSPECQLSSSLEDTLRNCQVKREGLKLLIWTTTPWTIPANMAIAVNADMDYVFVRLNSSKPDEVFLAAQERIEELKPILGDVEVLGHIKGSQLVGTEYQPLFHLPEHPLPRVMAARYVSADSGTGLVHTAPAHGADDYNTFLSQGLLAHTSIPSLVDGEGQFTETLLDMVADKSIAERLVGKFVLGAGTRIMIEIMQENSMLLAEQKIQHKYPYDWKTKKPVIVRATSQWFANLDDIKATALNALKHTTFHPEASRTRLEAFIRERSEWCISRQRRWGVPIPALHNAATGEAILTGESLSHIISVLESKGVAHWWDGPVEDFLPASLANNGRIYEKGTDTIDVWFDSGTSWSLINDGHGEADVASSTPAPDATPLADVCLEGSDQHRGWFQSLLLTRIGSTLPGVEAKSPYKTLITHGFVLDQEGKKMSKSIGNVISPLTIIHGGKNLKKDPAYGADVLRLWAATVEYGKDMSVGPTILAQTAQSLRKIRNTARFILGNTGNTQTHQPVEKGDMNLIDRYVMHRLYLLEKSARQDYATFNFHRVVQSLTTFANTTLSSLYFDVTKDCLYAESPDSKSRRAVVAVLEKTLDTMLSVTAPITPHLAEEIHQALNERDGTANGLSAFANGWGEVDEKWNDPQVDRDMQSLLSVRSVVLDGLEKARRNKQIGSSLEARVEIRASEPLAQLLLRELDILPALFIVSDAQLLSADSPEANNDGWSITMTDSLPDVTITIRASRSEKCPRCWQWTKSEEDELCMRCVEVVPPS